MQERALGAFLRLIRNITVSFETGFSLNTLSLKVGPTLLANPCMQLCHFQHIARHRSLSLRLSCARQRLLK